MLKFRFACNILLFRYKFLKAHGVSIFILQSDAILGIIFHHIFVYFWSGDQMSMAFVHFAEFSAGDVTSSTICLIKSLCNGFIGFHF